MIRYDTIRAVRYDMVVFAERYFNNNKTKNVKEDKNKRNKTRRGETRRETRQQARKYQHMIKTFMLKKTALIHT